MESHKERILELVPAIRMILSSKSLKTGQFVPLDQLSETDPQKISAKTGSSISLFKGNTEELLAEVEKSKDHVGEQLFIEDLGLLTLSGSSEKEEQTLLYNKVVAITGGAMGYGEGIARQLFSEGAHVVLMDINEEAGNAVAGDLNSQKRTNRAFFVKTDVTSLESVSHAVYETVLAFSGLDVMISNAGVLKAGGIEEMDPGSFDFVTRVNYNGYFNVVKAATPIMKRQTKFGPGYFTDIIQINSKSGIEGSKKNFAYAGSKFAGIGLTHSFAMELMPDRIKVNAICPGNFFEGPLWSDPEKGLFIQYLNAGKVPGAKTIADVKRHYESLVPAGRGCRITDVVKAIKYVIDQEYETGQAIPVTGGQVMLS
jgi:sorbitol-6-phosphate 2-dehydrogenase